MNTIMFDAFITENSTPQSRANATYVYPKLVQNTSDYFEYAVQGSERVPYTITIELDNDIIKATSCTCPYDYAGVCKHIIASLKALKKGYKTLLILKKL